MGDCFLHNFTLGKVNKPVWDRVNEDFLQLLTNYLKTPSDLMPLGMDRGGDSGALQSCFSAFEDATLELKVFEVGSSPSNLSAYAVARETVIKYRERLKVLQGEVKMSRDEKLSPIQTEVPVAKLLQMGLHCLCELLADISQRDPDVCRNALKALDHLLASQKPEEMAFESKLLTDKLFTLLSQLRCIGGGQTEIVSLANSCLISLAIGYGLPEYMLKTAAQLIFDNNGESFIRPPPNFISLYNLAFNRNSEPSSTWIHVAIDSAHPVVRVSLPARSEKLPVIPQSGKKYGAIASDGQNLYVINDGGVSRIGSGFSRSRRGFLYKISTSFKASMPVWLAVVNGRLYLRPNSLTKIWSADAETFEFAGDYHLDESLSDGVLCSDGSKLYRISQQDSFSLRISTLDERLKELETEDKLLVSLKQTKTNIFGDHPTLSLPEAMTSLRPGVEEKIVDIKLGSRLGTLLTTRGKIYYIGAGHLFDMPDSFDKWVEFPMADKITSMSIGHNGSHILMLTATGSLLFFGTPYRGEDGETRKLKKQPTPVRNKQIPTIDGKKVISYSASNGTTAFITEKGRLFLHGKDVANCDPATGEVLGLEGIQMYYVALGKAHCAALSKRGLLYTFGMNNFGQCGRLDLSITRDSDTESSRTTDEDLTLDYLTPNVCPYGQHKWVKEELNRCQICSHPHSGPPSTSSSSVKSSPASRPSPAHITFCTVCLLCQKCAYRITKKRQDLQDQMEKECEVDSARSNLILPPAMVPIRGLGEGKVVQISVGYYHTLALSQQGKVFAFGSNRHGQLGLGHLKSVVSAELVPIPATVCQVACGNGHSLCRTTDGRLFTFGKYNNGQLIRLGREPNWFASPGLAEGLDQQRVTWVSASGDCTVVTCECPLLSGNLLRSAAATANRNFFMLFPKANSYVVVNRQNGKVKTFKTENLNLSSNVLTLDPLYDVLWCYDIEGRKVTGLSPQSGSVLDEKTLFLENPEFAIPSVQNVELSTSHLATTLLSSYYLLHQKRNRNTKTTSPSFIADLSPSSAYFTVTRFQNYGGGWGYSQQSVEAIQFSSDRDILLVGYGLYGGRGEYSARLKLFKISRYDPEEEKTELLDETEEIQFESQAQERSHVFLTRPILCKAREWLIAWVSINGPSSDCGAGGQPVVAGEDGAVFSFRNSRMSNNGTDVTSGQIPSLLYKPSPETTSESVSKPTGTSLHSANVSELNLSCRFFNAVTPSCFASLLKILITAVEENLRIIRTTNETWLLERNESAAIMALELTEKYIKLVCPTTNGFGSEDREILACIEETFQILSTVLHYGSIEDFEKNCYHLLEVCGNTFVSCFHVFFPDSGLLQEFTLDLLKFKDGSRNSWLLQSVFLALEATDYPVTYLSSENRDGLFPALTTFLRTVRGGGGIAKPPEFGSLLQSLIEVIFGETGRVGTRWSPDILSAGFQLLAKMAEELVTTSSLQSENPPLMQTGCRFSRLSLTMSWDTGLGAPDAIAFHVDSPWVTVHGVGAYLGTGSYAYTLELLVNRAVDVTCDQWQVLEKTSGTVAASDLPGDYGFIKLTKPVRLVEGTHYAFRLQLQGNRTWSGESGAPSVIGVNGCKFTFFSSSLSLNGTNVIRGQIPVILYSITDHLKTHRISTDLAAKWFLEALKSLTTKLQQFFSTLLYNPTILVHQKKLGHVAHFVSKLMGYTIAFLNQKPGSVLEILGLMDELLPLVTSLTVQKQRLSDGKLGLTCSQVVVESLHPYKSATVQSHCVRFPEDVRYVSVEFDGRCSSAQVEDSFQLYLETPGGAQVPVGRFWGSQNWPKNVVLLPGNCVWLLFESASNYNRAEEQMNFGFKCQVTGFSGMPAEPLLQLEREFAYLYSYGCSILMQQSSRLQQSLTLSNEFGSLDEEASEMLKTHGQLLKKGLALYHIPTPKEIVGGKLPLQDRSPEILFLKDFIIGAQNTAGGKLARWIMPESIVEPSNCDLQVDCRSRPIVITVITKDQYGRIAYAPGISVDINITAVPTEQGRSKGATSHALPATLQAEIPYQATYLNKARYVCISMMKPFRNYSFEELRVSFATGATMKDSLQTSSNEDGSFVAKWQPRQSGQFRIEATVDSFSMGKSQMFEIQDGHVVYQQLNKRLSQLSRVKSARVKDGMTRGVRLRTAPSLLAKEVGVIGRSAPLDYMEELKNGDGNWLKLSEDSALRYCQGHAKLNPTSVWCLQYNRHLDRLLIDCDVIPSDENFEGEESAAERSIFLHSVVVACDERYVVTNAGAAGVEIHSHPQKSAAVVGVVLPHEEIHSIGWIQNSDAIWVQLHRSTLDKVVTSPGVEDGFCVAQELSGTVFLERLRSQDGSLLTPTRTGVNGNPSEPSTSRNLDIDGGDNIGVKQVGTQTFKNAANNTAVLRPKNGNVKESHHKTVIRIPPQNSPANKLCAIQAVSPSFADCVRSVFAAFVWHESLAHDTMASASYLKFHPELQCAELARQLIVGSDSDSVEESGLCYPATLYLLYTLWREVYTAVQAVVDKHLILPSPPMTLKTPCGDKQPVVRHRDEHFCELCEQWQPAPVTFHMRAAHRGCGLVSGGQGYNSLGKYTLGWTGNCGDGGCGSSTWYLLCSRCRQNYLQSTESSKERQRKEKAREFRSSSGSVEPTKILKNNAEFLLSLNSADSGRATETFKKSHCGWNINLFPAGSPTNHSGPGTSLSSGNGKSGGGDSDYNLLNGNELGMAQFAHASDPGPKRNRMNSEASLPSSEPLYPMCISATSKEKSSAPGVCDSQLLICSPSAALKSLANEARRATFNATLKRPVIAFVIQHHNLPRVREAMQLAIVRSTAYSHAFQVLVWLLHQVSSQYSVEDILWCAIRGLSGTGTSGMSSRRHWTFCLLSGPVCQQMLDKFNQFLYSVVTIMRSGSVTLELQEKCLKCWLLGFLPFDHSLILKSHILQVIHRIMSDSSCLHSNLKGVPVSSPDVELLEDITAAAQVDVSSRKAMVGCLTDLSTETFWESGEEDRGCPKMITLRFSLEQVRPVMVGIHIDNTRDPRISSLTAHILVNNSRHRLFTRKLDGRFVGWAKFLLTYPVVHIELRSVEPVIRVRQILALGMWKNRPAKPIQQSPSYLLQFNTVQAEAFKLFQLIAANAFNEAFTISEDSSIRDQIVEILFSKDQLNSLQAYVGSQITSALDKEILQLRDNLKRNTSYCYGLISLLEKLCSSNYGIRTILNRTSTLVSLSQLLVFSYASMQAKVVEVLKMIVGAFDPECLEAPRFLENFLRAIAKALTLQVREKTSRQLSTATVESNFNSPQSSWHVSKPVSTQVATQTVDFLVDMAYEKYGRAWGDLLKETLATHLLSLASIPDELRHNPSGCLRSGRFWLCVASLCVLRDESWLGYSPLWRNFLAEQTELGGLRPLCDNHDDNTTLANVWCEACRMHLCRECGSVLHLSKRSRQHQVEQLSVADNKLTVNVNESCGRLKLTWILLSIDSSTMNGMAEFRSELSAATLRNIGGECRFCGNNTGSELTDVCSHEDCQHYSGTACRKSHKCGHLCNGILDEAVCLPCLKCHTDESLKQDADDMCVICFTDTLVSAPSVQLACGHVFHSHCVRNVLSRRWPGPRINFSFLLCPICKADLDHPAFWPVLAPLRELRTDVSKKALTRLDYEGMSSCKGLSSPNSPYYQNPGKLALDKFAYYICHKCQKPYFGGEVQCDPSDNLDFDPAELLCGGCSDVAQAQVCPKHGTDYLEYKCRYCCSVAVFFCFGTTHFCAHCHEDFQRIVALPKHQLPPCPAGAKATQLEGKSCPLRLKHPPTGEEFALGCGICRNVQTF